MSDREFIFQLLDRVPDYKLGYVIAYIQGITANDISDEQYCQGLMHDYLTDNDSEKHSTIALADLAKQEGIEL